MPKSVIIPAGSSAPLAPFVPGTLADGVVYVSGTLAFDQHNNVLFADDPKAQTRHVLETIRKVIETAGGTMADVTFNTFIAPFASEFPKPGNGTVAPAPPISTNLSYIPNAPNIAPAVTKITNILAGVNFVVSIRICPITHIIPPTIKAFKYSILVSPFYFSLNSIATACAIPGILSPCKDEVVLIRAPVEINKRFFISFLINFL